jgi:hypothetical protein
MSHRSRRAARAARVVLAATLAGAPTLLSAQQAVALAGPAPVSVAAPVAAPAITPAAPVTGIVAAPVVDAPALPTADAARAAAVRPVRQASAQEQAALAGEAAAPRRQNVGQPMALMIVGGAALVTGLIIGGDVGTLFAVGGAAVGLYGLYQYLR